MILTKALLVINKSVFESSWFRFDGPSKTLVFYFSFFNFDDFQTAFAKNLMKKWHVFITDIKSSYKFLLSHKDLRSRNFWQWNDGPLNFFAKLNGNAFSLFIFIKWKNHFIFPFTGTYKMYCCHLLYRKLKLRKTAVFTVYGPSKMVFHFFKFFTFSCFRGTFVKNFMKKLSIFNTNF